jgi:hypothetical protein
MNDFSELENELKKLRPAQPSKNLMPRIERALAEQTLTEAAVPRWRKFLTYDPAKASRKIAPLSLNPLGLGLGLAAAALLLIFARIGVEHPGKKAPAVASITPAPGVASIGSEFVLAGLTQVVYNTRNEGLHFATDSEQPMRRVRSQTRQTLQWCNPRTGASLRVSYPSEEVELIPISGQ